MIRVRPRSLRGRLALIFAIGSATVVMAGGVVLYNDLADSADRSVNSDLRRRASTIADTLSSGGLELPRREPYAQVYVAGGTVLTYTDDLITDGTRLLSNREVDLVFNEGPRLFDRTIPALLGDARLLATPASLPAAEVVIVVGASLEQTAAARQRLLVGLGLAGGTLIAVFAAGGWMLAGAALRPVQRMTDDAAEISSADTRRRLSVPPTGDEIAHLGQTLNAMLDRIEAAFRRERQFVDDASHELRTPLAIMRAELELALGESNLAPEIEATLKSVAEEVERLTQLAEDLLVLARAGAGELARSVDPLDLLGAASVVCDRLERSVPGGPAITVTGERVSAPFHRDRFQRMLTNLVSNAQRHAVSHIEVRIVLRGTDTAELTVADDGPGFAPDLLGVAFERFAVADAARTRTATTESTGLGLAIVKALVETQGGTVQATNGGPFGGAVLTVAIPLAAA